MNINYYKNQPIAEIKAALDLAYDHEQGIRATLAEADTITRTLRAAKLCATVGAWPGDVVQYQGKKYRLLDDPSESMFALRGRLIKGDGTESARANNLYVNDIKLIQSA